MTLPRLTVGRLMAAVAALAVLLGVLRAHFSLGSLAFGLISVAIVRTRRFTIAQRAAGRTVSRFAVVLRFMGSLWFAAERLTLVFLGTLVLFFFIQPGLIELMFAHQFGRHGPRFDPDSVIYYAIFGPMVAWGLPRLARNAWRWVMAVPSRPDDPRETAASWRAEDDGPDRPDVATGMDCTDATGTRGR